MFVASRCFPSTIGGQENSCCVIWRSEAGRWRSTRAAGLNVRTPSPSLLKSGSRVQKAFAGASSVQARQPVAILESAAGDLSSAVTVATTALVLGSESSVSLVAPLRSVLGLLFTLYTVLFLLRFVIPWFPQIREERFPWSIVLWATEGVLRPTRRLIPPQGGVDITPLVWLALTSLSQELLVGAQGILTLLAH